MQYNDILNLPSSISCMDINKNGDQIIAGGKDYLKLIQINKAIGSNEQNKIFEVKTNLRRLGSKFSIGYLEFNRVNQNLLVSASVQGNVSVWDVSDYGIQIFNEKPHGAAVNRMNWRPNDESIMISGGQDQIINLYDLRSKQVIKEISRLSSSVRDVKFNPFSPDYFMAATESGLLEIFDIRKSSQSVGQISGAHTNVIQCLDWNKKYPNIVASGSIDNDIKIWSVSLNHQEIEEKIKIKHVQGVADLKWHQKNPNLISVTSLNRETSVTVYDITCPFRPQTIIKGHKELITSFVYYQNEENIITGCKDGILLSQSIINCSKPYATCPRYPITFNQKDEFLCKLENPNDDIHRAEIEFFKQSSQNLQNEKLFQSLVNVWDSRPVTFIKRLDQVLSEKIKSLSLEDEVYFFQMNYVSSQNNNQVFQNNSLVAQKAHKQDLAFYWLSLQKLVDDFDTLSKEVDPSYIVQIMEQNLSRSEQLEDQTKQLITEGSINQYEQKLQFRSHANSNKIGFKNKEKKNNFLKALLKFILIQIKQICTQNQRYFNENPIIFQQEIQQKNILFQDNHLRIHKDRVDYYRELLWNFSPLNLIINKQSMLLIITKSCQDLIQKVIDDGELQTGFWMFNAIKKYQIIGMQTVEIWTKSYIEFLLSFKFFSFTVKVAYDCPIQEIRNSNNYKMYQQCTQCNKEIEKVICNCNTQITCSRCQLPIKGLMIWCQICLHAGHLKEYHDWFQTNQECPSGCGHKCFLKNALTTI